MPTITIEIEVEELAPGFTKYHLRNGPWPFEPVIHHFTPELRDVPHDHPWGFMSYVLWGWMTETQYEQGQTHKGLLVAGSTYSREAEQIHSISCSRDCWTLCLYGWPEQDVTFYPELAK